jgi:hypothetical protein
MGESAQLCLAQRYWPVFELFRGKRWVLEAHALQLSEGTKGNIFRLPDGNVLVTVVTAQRSVDGDAFDLDLPLAVRLADAAEFQAAYFLSPDLLGKRRLAFERQDNGLKIVLPRHRSTSAVLLAKTGVHAALDGPWEMLPGQHAEAAMTIDNWTPRTVAGTLRLPGQNEQSLNLASGASERRAVTITAPPMRRGLREAIAASVTLDGRPCAGDFEFCVDLPLHMTVRWPEGLVCQDQAATVRVDVVNFAAARQVEVELRGDALRVDPAVQGIHLAARAKESMEFRFRAARPGKLALQASASAGDDRSQAQQELEVFATKASPAMLKQIRSGRLHFDVFGSDAGKYEDKPVLVNGRRIGVVPQQGDSWAQVELPLTPDALAALREDNEVRIENAVGDAFKVRNFQLRLQGAVGLVSEMNSGVFTSCGWEYQEGKVFPFREPLTGIRLRIPHDLPTTAK